MYAEGGSLHRMFKSVRRRAERECQDERESEEGELLLTCEKKVSLGTGAAMRWSATVMDSRERDESCSLEQLEPRGADFVACRTTT